MAFLMPSQRLRARMLHLPPSPRIRASVLQQNIFKRSFSSTNVRRADLTTAIASAPAALLDTLHAFMPWYVAIPTAAVLVRGGLLYHLAVLPTRKQAIVRSHLYPLWNRQSYIAWKMYQLQTLNKLKTEHKLKRGYEPFSIPRLTRVCMLGKMVWINFSAQHKTGAQHGAPIVSWRSFLTFGTLIAFTEALRIKCGSREGLLPILLYPVERAKEVVANPVPTDKGAVDTNTMTQDELLAQRLEMAHEAQRAGELPEGSTDLELLQQTHHLSPLNTPEYTAYLDPTLQTEGLSWCSDLTAIDPTFTLPIALSLTMAASAYLEMKQPADDSSNVSQKKTSKADASPSVPPEPIAPPQKQSANHLQAALKAAGRLQAAAPVREQGPLANLSTSQRISLTVSLLFFLVSIKLPAALLLYLVPTFVVAILQKRWLDMKYPLPEVIRPSKRPMRVKAKKDLEAV